METLLKDNKTLLAAVTKYKNGLQQAKQLLEENQRAHEETLRGIKKQVESAKSDASKLDEIKIQITDSAPVAKND